MVRSHDPLCSLKNFFFSSIVSHTAEEIASLVKDLVNVEFMLENRLDSIGTDQGANFLAAVRLLIEEGVSEEQVRCSCHKLQLSIKTSLEVSDLYMQIVQFNMYLSLSTGTAQSTGCCSCHTV